MDVWIDDLHLGSKHQAKDDCGTDSDAHAQARQLDLGVVVVLVVDVVVVVVVKIARGWVASGGCDNG